VTAVTETECGSRYKEDVAGCPLKGPPPPLPPSGRECGDTRQPDGNLDVTVPSITMPRSDTRQRRVGK
jgi:hypothetical protein